ncbi:histidinol-phosphatase [Martelella sp. AD-3]|uniref:histidinol-phosphatase n=1 Tax=Martelella sp. AD-3 TaxID=686597 RepID=UPI000466ED20|nr:histidinol-phosphatase [Martelella sp. AD-3]AMM83444.1 inositol monophosphatase [Martelella sp. AD-3]MAM09331.1 histidinol-phosphatase [Rhizobiaceae bacterium]
MLPDHAFFTRLADAAAAETLPRFRSGLDVDNKLSGGFDPVTEGDRAAESAIRRLIEETYPDHGILGEEHGASGLDREYVWVIDPIDGTRAFISGVPVWGTLIGLYRNGRAVMGLMDQPFTGERFFADPGGSLFAGPGGPRRLKTRDCRELGAAVLFTTSPRIMGTAALSRYDRLERQVRLARYGIDCYAYCLLASGFADLVVESDLKPYDVGALIAIIEGAGGVISTWTGERPEHGGDIVAAATPALHEAALAELNAA